MRVRLIACMGDSFRRLHIAHRADRRQDVNVDPARARQEPAGRQDVARALQSERHDGQIDARRDGESAAVKFAESRLRQERAFGKERERLAGIGGFQ